jgi:hypothetical protein
MSEDLAAVMGFIARTWPGRDGRRFGSGGVRSLDRTLLRLNSLISRESAGNFRKNRAGIGRRRALLCWNQIDFLQIPYSTEQGMS